MAKDDERCDRDEAYYRNLWGSGKTEQFYAYVNSLKSLVDARGWDNLYPCYVDQWCSFKKSRNRACFGIDGRGDDLRLYVKLSEEEARRFGIPFQYDPNPRHRQALYDVSSDPNWLDRFEPLLEEAYRQRENAKRRH